VHVPTDAAYGHTGGGIVNVVLKGGANETSDARVAQVAPRIYY